MSSQTRVSFAARLAESATTTCAARSGKLCRCEVCTSSILSTDSSVSAVSTVCPPSEPDDDFEDTATPSSAWRQPVEAFPSTPKVPNPAPNPVLSPILNLHPNQAPARPLVGLNRLCASPSKNSPSRANTLKSPARGLFIPKAPSAKAASPKKVVPAKRSDTVDDYEYDEPAMYLPEFPVHPARTIRARALAPTHSNYNLTPTPAIPLGRPGTRRRIS